MWLYWKMLEFRQFHIETWILEDTAACSSTCRPIWPVVQQDRSCCPLCKQSKRLPNICSATTDAVKVNHAARMGTNLAFAFRHRCWGAFKHLSEQDKVNVRQLLPADSQNFADGLPFKMRNRMTMACHAVCPPWLP